MFKALCKPQLTNVAATGVFGGSQKLLLWAGLGTQTGLIGGSGPKQAVSGS